MQELQDCRRVLRAHEIQTWEVRDHPSSLSISILPCADTLLLDMNDTPIVLELRPSRNLRQKPHRLKPSRQPTRKAAKRRAVDMRSHTAGQTACRKSQEMTIPQVQQLRLFSISPQHRQPHQTATQMTRIARSFWGSQVLYLLSMGRRHAQQSITHRQPGKRDFDIQYLTLWASRCLRVDGRLRGYNILLRMVHLHTRPATSARFFSAHILNGFIHVFPFWTVMHFSTHI